MTFMVTPVSVLMVRNRMTLYTKASIEPKSRMPMVEPMFCCAYSVIKLRNRTVLSVRNAPGWASGRVGVVGEMPGRVREYWIAPGLLVNGERKQYQSRHWSGVPRHREDVQLALKQMAASCTHPCQRQTIGFKGFKPPGSYPWQTLSRQGGTVFTWRVPFVARWQQLQCHKVRCPSPRCVPPRKPPT